MRQGLVIVHLALRSVLDRRLTAILTVLAVALSVTLLLGVDKIRTGARSGFERTVSGTDLIVGARSGSLNLLLYSVFHIGEATNNITWESYEDIADRPEVEWTIPISLGDSHRGFRVVGTTDALFQRYQYGKNAGLTIAAGKSFEDLFDVVVGAGVAKELGYSVGERIVLSHGLGSVSFVEHSDKPFEISGILAPTGTPLDRTVIVSLEAIKAIHIGWERGGPTPLARMVSADRVRKMNLAPDQITAFYVGLTSKVSILSLQRAINGYREEPLQAVMPGVALGQLWSVVMTIERALIGLSVFVILVGLLTILTTILTSLNERRREMAVLRLIGARPWQVSALLVAESGLLAFFGSVLAFVILYAGIAVLAPVVGAEYGVALSDLKPSFFDFYVVLFVPVASCLLGLIPAWQAFRGALAPGLVTRV